MLNRFGGTGGAGGAIAPPIFLKIGGQLAFSTPNNSRLVPNGPRRVISTPNILQLPPGLGSIEPLEPPLTGPLSYNEIHRSDKTNFYTTI